MDSETPNAAEGGIAPDADHQPHEWPQPDENFCSCCRGAIVDGLDNVLRVATSPERQLTLNGELRGVENQQPKYRAYLHALCAKRHYGLKVECDKCGVLCRAKTLSNGSRNTCGCICHDGANRCGYVIDPYTVPGMTRKV